MPLPPHTKRHSFPVMLVQSGLDVDHFAGLDRAMGERGVACDRVFPDQPPPRLTDRTRVVAISDTRASINALAVRQARRIGATVVLVMDGLVEFRNTFLNPRSGAQFLRPAPVDVIACAGEIDREVLSTLGNDAIATGLPRLRRLAAGPMPLPAQPAIMVATANHPAFNDDERARLIAALRFLKQATDRLGVPVRWRLTGDLNTELGVEPDRLPLPQSLATVSAVLTTPSTLMVESMLAGRPTGLLHIHPTPLWQPAAWAWCHQSPRGADFDATPPDWSAAAALPSDALLQLRDHHVRANSLTGWCADAAEMLSSMLSPDAAALSRQTQILRLLHQSDQPAPQRVADLIASVVEQPVPSKSGPPRLRCHTTVEFPSPLRLACKIPKGDKPRVVSCVVCDESAVGGVRTWSHRLAAAFARLKLGYDVRTLLIAVKPDHWRGQGIATNDLTDLCVIDPFADHTATIAAVRDCLDRMGADIVLPNYTDLTYAAAMQLRPRGVRTVAIAHTDEPYYRDMIATYDRWDAAVGVSRVCADWLAPIEEDSRGNAEPRPIAQITYGVPIAEVEPVSDRLRQKAERVSGPLRIAYIGRMVQAQKRIDDLLAVIDGLESRAVPFELHMVGDGPNLLAWRESLSTRTLARGRVIIHGARDPAWVESFLPTIDVSVLVSQFEGTSISMLEAMGQGVVPAVTAVSSGVSEWIDDGVSGIVVPVGQPDQMAARLADLSRDRLRLASIGRAAWERAKRDAGVDAMAWKYAELFDKVMARPADTRRTDLGLRLHEPWRWTKNWAEDEPAAAAAIEQGLRDAGYKRPVYDRAIQGCDAVIIRADLCADDHEGVVAERARLWRERGLGVVFAPHLLEPSHADADRHSADLACQRMRALVQRAAAQGRRRIAVYGTGKHTRRVAALFGMGLPLVGLMDDRPPVWEYMFGLPVVHADRAMADLSPDAVLLSSDAFEEALWRRCEPLRRQGVLIIPVYGSYEAAQAA